jgi:DNA repair ATPase RecN
MARLKRTSAVLDVARKRLSGLKGITPKANLGANLTDTIYEAKIDSVSARLDAYNQKLAELDQDQNDLQKEEAELNELNRRFLSAGEAVYGPDSSEYEMLGGTRKSERKKPTKKGGSGTGSPKP